MDDPGWFGPYRLTQSLPAARLGPLPACSARRWSAVDEQTSRPHVVYALECCRDRHGIRRFLSAAEHLSSLSHPHILSVGSWSLCARRGPCIVAAYQGDSGGLMTLKDLLRAKGGRMDPVEAHRAVRHMLEALVYLHERGIVDGCLGADRMLVSPRGSVVVELPGTWRTLWRRPADAAIALADVRAVGLVAHRLLTGVDPLPGAPLPQLAEAPWAGWLERSLGEGFTSAAQALDALLATPGPQRRGGLVQSLLGRLRGVQLF
jgi:hypothetical protein